MMKDGKPDHEHALHSRYKMELAAESEATIKNEMHNFSKLLPCPHKQLV